VDFLQTLVSFLVALGILVTFHEFGHYWVAKRAGVKILRFSIGFGRPLLRWQRGPDQTEFRVAAIPLGGYVKMLDEREGEVAAEEVHRAFNRQRVGVRAAIVAAGPLANLVLALVVYWLSYMVGVTGPRPFIDDVAPGGAAARAGLQDGDEILTVNGVPAAIWDNVLDKALSAVLDGQPLALEVAGTSALYLSTTFPGATSSARPGLSHDAPCCPRVSGVWCRARPGHRLAFARATSSCRHRGDP
jgi:regulator of sigma E protease